MAPADWNPRFVSGRTVRAFEFLQNQRRRYVLVAKWGEFMKDLDMFVGGADGGRRRRTRRPVIRAWSCPYKFDVPTRAVEAAMIRHRRPRSTRSPFAARS